MEARPEQPAAEIKRLERCINDLVGVTALPAVRGGGEPAEIVRTLLDVLFVTLSLDLIYVRSEVAAGGPAVEMARVAQPLGLAAGPREVGEVFDRWLGDDPRNWPPRARNTVGGGDMTVVPLPLGLRGEIGVLVAGSRRADFPQQTERLVLSVAAHQAGIGLQQARLLSEQRRVAGELDERVARRTSELAAANEPSQKEAAERRRAEEALREGERVRLSVQDAEVGFAPQDAVRLFDAFYTTKDTGMGIGLSVSRSIIESHQGRLWAAPNDGPGATFSFSIPHAPEAVTAASGDGSIPTPALADAERVKGGS